MNEVRFGLKVGGRHILYQVPEEMWNIMERLKAECETPVDNDKAFLIYKQARAEYKAKHPEEEKK